MAAVVSSNPTGSSFFFYFLKPSMSIVYRNVRFVLKTKNPNQINLIQNRKKNALFARINSIESGHFCIIIT